MRHVFFYLSLIGALLWAIPLSANVAASSPFGRGNAVGSCGMEWRSCNTAFSSQSVSRYSSSVFAVSAASVTATTYPAYAAVGGPRRAPMETQDEPPLIDIGHDNDEPLIGRDEPIGMLPLPFFLLLAAGYAYVRYRRKMQSA